MKDEKYKKIQDKLLEMEDKYCDLVWFARSHPDSAPGSPDDIRAGCFLSQCAVKAAYPKDVEKLCDSKWSDWTHGFNSGMLACLRFITTASEQSLDEAQDDFPMLDT